MGAPTLNAQYNWFGACAAPTCTDGAVDFSNWLCSAPATQDMEIVRLEPGTRILGVFPHPMLADVRVRFSLGEPGLVTAEVFDVEGRLVRSFSPERAAPGVHLLHWDGSGNGGNPVPTGVYFLRLAVDGQVEETTRIVVSR